MSGSLLDIKQEKTGASSDIAPPDFIPWDIVQICRHAPPPDVPDVSIPSDYDVSLSYVPDVNIPSDSDVLEDVTLSDVPDVNLPGESDVTSPNLSDNVKLSDVTKDVTLPSNPDVNLSDVPDINYNDFSDHDITDDGSHQDITQDNGEHDVSEHSMANAPCPSDAPYRSAVPYPSDAPRPSAADALSVHVPPVNLQRLRRAGKYSGYVCSTEVVRGRTQCGVCGKVFRCKAELGSVNYLGTWEEYRIPREGYRIPDTSDGRGREFPTYQMGLPMGLTARYWRGIEFLTPLMGGVHNS